MPSLLLTLVKHSLAVRVRKQSSTLGIRENGVVIEEEVHMNLLCLCEVKCVAILFGFRYREGTYIVTNGGDGHLFFGGRVCFK